MTYDDADVTPPQVSVVDNTYCRKDAGSGTCYKITDDFAIKDALVAVAGPAETADTYNLLSVGDLDYSGGEYFFLENADRKVLQVCIGNDVCFNAHASVVNQSDQVDYHFMSIVQYQMADILVAFSNERYHDYYVYNTPFQVGGPDPKDAGRIIVGDALTPFASLLYYNNGRWMRSNRTVLGFYTVTETPAFSLVEPGASAETLILVQDAQGNYNVYDNAGVQQ